MPLIATAIGVTLVRVTGVALQALVLIVPAHILPIADMGVFAMAYSGLSLARALGSIGADQIVLRHVAAGQRAAMPPEECMGAALAITTASSFCLVALLAGAFVGGIVPLTTTEVFAIAFAIPAAALTGVFAAYVRASGSEFAAQAPDSIGQYLVFTLLLGAWRFTSDRETALVFFSISGWAVVLCYALIWMRLPGSRLCKPARSTVTGVLQEGGQVFVAMCATALSVQAPVWLAGVVAGPNGAAILQMASRFGSLAGITTSSIGVTFSQHFAKSQDDERELSRSLRLSSILAATPAVLWLLVVSIGAPYAVAAALPPTYAPAAYPMAIIALAFVINAACGMSTNLFFMTGRALTVAWFSFGQLLVILVGAYWLTRFSGIAGIAWAMVIGALVRDGLCMVTWTAGRTWRTGERKEVAA